MNHIIIGANASGKTLYLKNLVKGRNGVVSNLLNEKFLYRFSVSQERVNRLISELDLDSLIVTTGVAMAIGDIKFSIDFLKVLYLLCLDADVLALDEPDLSLGYVEQSFLLTALFAVQMTYKDMYITSHDDNILGVPKSEFFIAERIRGTSDVKLVHIDRGKVHDYII